MRWIGCVAVLRQDLRSPPTSRWKRRDGRRRRRLPPRPSLPRQLPLCHPSNASLSFTQAMLSFVSPKQCFCHFHEYNRSINLAMTFFSCILSHSISFSPSLLRLCPGTISQACAFPFILPFSHARFLSFNLLHGLVCDVLHPSQLSAQLPTWSNNRSFEACTRPRFDLCIAINTFPPLVRDVPSFLALLAYLASS